MAIVGFIGLGIMGRPMAKNLINAGYKLVVYDKFAKFDDLVSLGAEGAVSSKEVASKSEIIITMLPNSPQVKEAILGAGGVIEGLKKETIVVDMSSIAPEACREVGAVIAEKNAAFLDAPVSGGEPNAVDGTLSIMVGGDEAAFEKVKPILEKMGSSVVLVGPPGSGNVVKLANQIITAVSLAGISEAFTLASKAGIDPQTVFDAIKDGLAGSAIMNAKIPKILEGNFKPGFRLELHAKDLQNALDTAHDLGVPLLLTAPVMEIMQALMVDGMATSDHSAIIKFYEQLAKVEVRKKAADQNK